MALEKLDCAGGAAGRPDSEAIPVPEETARRLDMLPIPVALLALGADVLAIEASNRAFHDAGVALDRRPSALIRALGTEIADFLASGDDQYGMTWQAGTPTEVGRTACRRSVGEYRESQGDAEY